MLGMLWFDNSKSTSVADKIRTAVTYYEQKYGKQPTLCYVHPQTLDALGSDVVDAVVVKSTRSVLPNHFHIGNEDNNSDNFRQGELLDTK